MHYETVRTKPRIIRTRKESVIAGVCGGLAIHFGVSITWMRIGWVFGAAMTFPVVPILYGVCILMMPLDGVPRRSRRRKQKEAPLEVHSFSNHEEAVEHLSVQFDDIEAKIRQMEDHVTSKEYVLKRKFEEL